STSTYQRRQLPRSGARSSSAPPGGSALAMVEDVGEQAIGAGHARRQLAEERQPRVDEAALAVFGHDGGALLRFLGGVVAGQDRLIRGVPLVGEVQPALLHPAGKTTRADLV